MCYYLLSIVCVCVRHPLMGDLSEGFLRHTEDGGVKNQQDEHSREEVAQQQESHPRTLGHSSEVAVRFIRSVLQRKKAGHHRLQND